MATLMVLGGGNCQLHAVERAKALGHRVVLIDYYKDPPAAAISDVHERVSTFDIPACEAAGRRHKIDGVFTIGTDQPVYTAAVVADALGLPSPFSVEAAYRATNKRAMKRAFTEHNVANAPYALVRRGMNADELSWHGDVSTAKQYVIKPLDSQGQRGVFLVPNAKSALARLDEVLSFSREDESLLEVFYESDEMTATCWLEDGFVHLLALTDRQHVPDAVHIGVCSAHRFPSIHADRLGEAHALCVQVARALGAENGPLYVQLLVGAGGLIVNEAALRIGGAFEDVFVPRVSGFDILGAVIGAALGDRADCSRLKGYSLGNSPVEVSMQMLFSRPCKIASVTPLERVLAVPGAVDANYNFIAGQTVPAFENATARFGHCVLIRDDGGIRDSVRELYNVLEVLGEDGHNMIIGRDFDNRAFIRE